MRFEVNLNLLQEEKYYAKRKIIMNNKERLKYYLAEDLKHFENKRPNFKDWLFHNEKWYIYHYLRHLRYIEYYKSGGNKMKLLYHWFLYKRLGFRLNYTIYPNTIGPGFHIYHVGGFVHIGPQCVIGCNCTLQPGVVFGNKHEDATDAKIIVGDNCYFGVGAKNFGPVTIGNNVTVGANSVVTKDIPDNTVVGGIPARVIKVNL